ncbi:MAG: hypothetical protein ACR2GN_02265 [Bacteroidia bacterium]
MNYFLKYLLPFVFLPFIGFSQSQAPHVVYSTTAINNETLRDFVLLLNKSTGKSWQIKNTEKINAPGISLLLSNHTSFKTKESFRLQSNGKDQLIITSSSPEGLIFGFYKHLREQGFKFYLPDELYTIVPKLVHPFGIKKDIIDQPFLQVRNFFGTGGFGSLNPDAEKHVANSWHLWKQRNGFGASYELAGHRGENFILENYDLLKKHPQWLASPITGDKQKDQNIKINYSNKEGLNFYTDWSLKPLKEKGFNPPPLHHSYFMSMEPSDGGGFINNNLSISDQVYNAANVAAKKLDQLFPNHPNIGVNLYAYSAHAAPPSFPLHPRVFVQIIPYQFQNVAFGPSFIKLWASKVKRFALYDYYNYTDAQYDVPGGLTLDVTMKRLVHSVRAGSEGVNYETSYSKFATGISLYVLGRYMTDGDTNLEKNLESLTRDLYGNSSSKMLQLFNLFYRNPNFGPQYMGNATSLLKDAISLSKDAAVQNRLHELKLYLQHINLVFQSKDLSKGNLEQRLLPLAEYAWKIYPTRIIHSYRIMQLVSYAFLNSDPADKNFGRYQQLHTDWFPETDRTKTAWGRIKQSVNSNTSEKDFQLLQKQHNPNALPELNELKQIHSLIQTSNHKAQKRLVFGGSYETRGYFSVYTDKPAKLEIKYQVNGKVPKLVISSSDKNYTGDTVISINKSTGTLTLKLPAGETNIFLNAGDDCSYRIQADLENGFYFFDGSPRGKLAFYKNFNSAYEEYTYEADFYPSHFFMPSNISSVDYKVQLNTLSITSPLNRTMNSSLVSTEHGGFENRKFNVQANEGGKMWKAVIPGNYNYSFLNIPDRYFLLLPK